MFNSGKPALHYSGKEDNYVLESAKKALKTMFPTTYEDPIAHKRTDWKSDPFSYGSFSFTQSSSTVQVFENLR
jgi:monoamine oxidase